MNQNGKNTYSIVEKEKEELCSLFKQLNTTDKEMINNWIKSLLSEP